MSEPLPLILASSSPRRRELAGMLGFPVVCAPADVDERSLPDEPPGAHVLRVARAKATTIAGRDPGGPVLGADTSVVVGERILGKPRDAEDARAMLELLSGRSHLVLTALCLIWRARVATRLESAVVTFRRLDAALIDWYLASGEGADKAGAYAVQGLGGALITRVEGNVQAVVGLPLAPLLDLLATLGIAVSAAGSALVLTALPSPSAGVSAQLAGS